eukprot:2931793-Rhodomonas_salina.1
MREVQLVTFLETHARIQLMCIVEGQSAGRYFPKEGYGYPSDLVRPFLQSVSPAIVPGIVVPLANTKTALCQQPPRSQKSRLLSTEREEDHRCRYSISLSSYST